MDNRLLMQNIAVGAATFAAAVFLNWNLFELMLLYWFEMALSTLAGAYQSFIRIKKPGGKPQEVNWIALAVMAMIYCGSVGILATFSFISVFRATGQFEQMPRTFFSLVAYAIGRFDIWLPSLLLLANYERERRVERVPTWIEPFVAGFERMLFLLCILVCGTVIYASNSEMPLLVLASVILLKSLLDSVSRDRVIILGHFARMMKN